MVQETCFTIEIHQVKYTRFRHNVGMLESGWDGMNSIPTISQQGMFQMFANVIKLDGVGPVYNRPSLD